ncbi:hypothetical protein AKJ49_01300 [candidate division MSBL1 archaeon SCGC-AAA382A03]|uniref:PIN domain-containing protein n=1 Tax=candidate division MSBL1 archaeon SCGC-AAA382A03 TaxID=1698278 RepID=A0A133VFL5_9EURY|nr:hypothetical protein AKJ49_01300 [candidate division MSBL1 archaeon SCGC-AAA382A03]
MQLLCDTDLLSVFAKVESPDLTRKAFPQAKFLISESVHDELSVSMEERFDFPKRILTWLRLSDSVRRKKAYTGRDEKKQ